LARPLEKVVALGRIAAPRTISRRIADLIHERWEEREFVRGPAQAAEGFHVAVWRDGHDMLECLAPWDRRARDDLRRWRDDEPDGHCLTQNRQSLDASCVAVYSVGSKKHPSVPS
jgi:hypothetical protein